MMPSELFIDHEKIVLTAEGKFLSNGEEISHQRTVEAFHRFLGHDLEGYFIKIGADFKRIEVEDTAYFVEAIDWKDDRLLLRISDGSTESLDPTTLRFSEPRLTCRIKDGKEEAKFLRVPYLEFFLHASEEGEGFTFRLGEKNFHLGSH
ncbi:MAG: hypothetical protein H7301_00260 [Cryobacterium sp.]|nr:hypothetical protein [Oligoflexia bacterium]